MHLRVGVCNEPNGSARGVVSGPRVVFRKGCPPEVVVDRGESGRESEARSGPEEVPGPGAVLAKSKVRPAWVLEFDGKRRRRRVKAPLAQQELVL